MTKEKNFIQITNKEIYNEIQALKTMQQEHFNQITSRQDKTNGKVKLSLWMATTAITLTTAIALVLIKV